MSDDALEVEQPTTELTPAAETPSFKQFSDDRKAGKVDGTAGGESMSPGGNQWDGDKNKFVNKAPRDEQGRFAKVRESLEKSQQKSTFVRAVLDGMVEPDETTMDSETWAAARNAQIERGSNKITPPDFGPEKPAQGAATAEIPAAEQPLAPEHEALVVKLQSQSHRSDVQALDRAIAVARDQGGATPKFFTELAAFAATCPNGEKVLLHFGEYPQKMIDFSWAAAFAPKPQEYLQKLVRSLSQELSASENAARQPQPAAKPRPPEPVGARASTSAFDVYDDKMDADEWARQRNAELAKRRGR